MKKQTGSSHIVVVIVLVLALITTVGWIFWQNFVHKEPVAKETEIVKVESQKKNDESPAKTEDSNEGYVVVKEWGLKIKMTTADSLSYSISSHTGGRQNTQYDALGLSIKSNLLTDQNCTKFGSNLYRQLIEPTEFQHIKIGSYYYFVTGAPGPCSENKNDIDLQNKVLKELVVENISSI